MVSTCQCVGGVRAYWWSKLLFYHVVGNVDVSSSSLCDACQRRLTSLLSISLFYFLSPLMKITSWYSFLFLFQFQSLFFWFMIFFPCFLKNFYLFQSNNSIPIYHISFFLIWSLLFLFLFVFLSHFVKVLLVLNFIIQLKFMVYCFF